MLDVTATGWAGQNFGNCELGDARRTRRAVQVAQQMAEYPNGSTPDQCENWSDLKATYRLFDCDDVTFTALAEPHWELTRSKARGTVLLLGDTMETNFGHNREVKGFRTLSRGSGTSHGFFLHSSLMVDAESAEIIGLAGQELFYRQPVKKNETTRARNQRRRESEVWGRVIDLIGPPTSAARYIHVFDRGADDMEVFCHLIGQRCDWVIRAAQ